MEKPLNNTARRRNETKVKSATNDIEKGPYDERKMEAQHRDKKIHSKALQFPTNQLLLGTRRHALL
jgi:hypothetical protein